MAGNGPPGQGGTFGQWRDWANSRSPGAGDQWIAWVKANNNVPPPYAVNLNSRTFGPTGPGANNTAADWFGAWLLLGQLAPDLAKALAQGITAGARAIPKAYTGAARGIGKIPGIGAIGSVTDFLSRLGEASLWIRVAEVLLGLGLIIVGLAKIASGTAAGKAAVKVGKAAAIL